MCYREINSCCGCHTNSSNSNNLETSIICIQEIWFGEVLITKQFKVKYFSSLSCNSLSERRVRHCKTNFISTSQIQKWIDKSDFMIITNRGNTDNLRYGQVGFVIRFCEFEGVFINSYDEIVFLINKRQSRVGGRIKNLFTRDKSMILDGYGVSICVDTCRTKVLRIDNCSLRYVVIFDIVRR